MFRCPLLRLAAYELYQVALEMADGSYYEEASQWNGGGSPAFEQQTDPSCWGD